MDTKARLQGKMIALLLTVLSLVFVISVIADPGGPIISYLHNETSATVGNPAPRTDLGGYITTMNLNISQQSQSWKAYVGNVTGRLTLDDASNYTIYDWAISTIQGEIYATRTSTAITWANVRCANLSQVDQEMVEIGHTASSTDSLNSTFNYTTHPTFDAGPVSLAANACNSTTYLYSNDTAQTSIFSEVLLFDGTNVMYTAILENSDSDVGYWWYNSTQYGAFDFQLMVGENASASDGFTYYFYVELS